MTQQYTDPVAQARMRNGRCPECGQFPDEHLDSVAFWMPRVCTLLPRGVRERIGARKGNTSGVPDAVPDARPEGPASTEE